MAEINYELLKEVTPKQKAFFIAYPWLLGLLWFAAGARGFFFLLHCTGSALLLFPHTLGADIAITLLLLALPIALWLGKEFLFKKNVGNDHTVAQLFEAWYYADQHPAEPEVADRWGKKNSNIWIICGVLIFLALCIFFSWYGLH